MAEVAKWLQVEEQAVTELADQGDLPGRKLAGEWRFAPRPCSTGSPGARS